MAKVLIVDDNPSNRSLLVDILQRAGHTIREASDGNEALALVSGERPDLVITDVLMPTVDGYEFVRRLRSTPEIAHTPVIFWTAVFRENDARDLARECGVEYTIFKPCTEESVRRTVEACLNSKAPPSPVAENFDRDHLRVVMDKLSKQVVETAAVNARLDSLLEACLRLASETDPARMLDEFCKSACNLVSAKFGIVGIAGEDGDLPCLAGLSWELYPGLKDTRRLHAVMAGLVSGSQPARARNTGADPAKFGFPAGFPNFSSLLAAPIASPTQRYGWLCLFHRLGAVEFTEEDARLTGILGDLAGRIYENRRFYVTAQTQKMEALGQLAGGMAHDFNNTLNVIIGYSQLLLAKSEESDPAYRRIEEIYKAGERAAALTNQLLAFSGRQMLEPRAVRLADLLVDLEPELGTIRARGVEIAKRWNPGSGAITIDPIQLRAVILSVLENAQDAMPAGGRLTIDLASQELDESSARAHGLAAGRYAVLSVTDSGCGMSAEVQQRAFDPFFTTKPPGQGVGLGLAASYGIIKQSGGRIVLESTPGAGTTCRVLLPECGDRVESAFANPESRANQRSRTILVVEDDPAIRLLIEEILNGAGYAVLTAGSGKKAIQLLEEHTGDIHLLLTDVVLPSMGGKEIASRIASIRPGIKVLFMSGYTGNAADERENLAPGVQFLQKPFSPEALCEKISGILSTSTPIRRVLVVDDDPSLRNLLARTLEGAGFQAFTAEDGHDARMQVEQHQIELVITDLAMPREEGMELIRALKREHPQVKIVAMSGAFGADVLRAAGALGAHVSLVKPLSAETLLRCIDQLSNG